MRTFVFICFVGLALGAPASYNYNKGQNLPGAVTSNLQLQQLPSNPNQSIFKSQPHFFTPSVPSLPSSAQTESFSTLPLASSVPFSTSPTFFGPQFQTSTLPVSHDTKPHNHLNFVTPNFFNTKKNLVPQVQQAASTGPHQKQNQQNFNQLTKTNGYQKYLPPTEETVISKHFYVHSAPEEPEEEVQEHQVNLGPARKNYRVVFIKAPVEPERKAALRIAQPQSEEKTAIYVLTKKTDPTEIRAALEATPTSPTKPEVYFIKYKTVEEAVHAQQQIQAQYDALGGISEVTDEGYAPVSSAIGSLGSSETHNVSTKLNQLAQNAPHNPYLPSFAHSQ